MAGMVRQYGSGGPGAAPPGYIWDPKSRAYTTQGSLDRRAAAAAEAARPKFDTDPMGRVHQLTVNADGAPNWQQVGTVPGLDALDGVARGRASGAGGGAGTEPNRELIAKIDDAMNRGPVSVNPPPTFTAPPTPELGLEMTPAERGHFSAAKVRSGQRLRAGMKDLDAVMNARGLTGNRIHSGAMSALVSQALGEMEDTERGVLSTRQNRVRELENMGYQGATHAANQNFGAQQQYNAESLQAQLAQRSQLVQLLNLYGMAY
jgi:hypothetical protein